MRRGRLDFVASTKALPHEQNEQVRALSEHTGRSIDDILHGVERERGPRGNRGALAVVSLLLNEALDPAVTVAKVCL